MSVHKRTYQRQDGKVSVYYLAVVKVKGLKPVSKQFERKLDAETWEREQRVQLAGDPRGHSFNPSMTVNELADRWLEEYANKSLEKSSADRYDGMLRHYIRPSFGTTRLMELDPVHVEAWLHDLTEKHQLAAKTANGCLGLLRKMLNDAARWRLLTYNPTQTVKPLRESERDFAFWTVEEGERFLAHARASDPTVFYAAAIALYTGMRLGEIQSLKSDCIDLGNRLITVKRTFCLKEKRAKEWTKTKRIRRIPINGSLHEILIELRRGCTTEFVLPDFDYHHAPRVIRRVAEEAKVKPIRFHDLRHSFASNYILRGGSIYKLQRLLGHTSVQMTERYSHLSPEHLADATELLDYGTHSSRTHDHTQVDCRRIGSVIYHRNGYA